MRRGIITDVLLGSQRKQIITWRRDQTKAYGQLRSYRVSLSVRRVEEVRDALKKGARLASVGSLETVLYQALRGWLQDVTR